MSNFLGEKYDIKAAQIGNGVSSWDSQPFALKDTRRVTVLISVGSPQSSVLATAVAGATFMVVCGTNSEVSAMAALTGATLVLGQTTIGQCNKLEVGAIAAHGTMATGVTLIVDDTTFTVQPNSCVADKNVLSSACSAFIHSVVSAIATHCTHLETFGLVTAGNATATALIYVRRKDNGPRSVQSFNLQTTSNAASSDGIYVQAIRQSGMIEFTPFNVLATNSSYTHFGIRMQQVATNLKTAVTVIREVGFSPSSVSNRRQAT